MWLVQQNHINCLGL